MADTKALARAFRKKPVEVEAWQLTEESFNNPMPDWLFDATQKHKAWVEGDRSGISIVTLEGTMKASFGDWIIKGVAGELYPCKPDIFTATYEPADALAPTGATPSPDLAALRERAQPILTRLRDKGYNDLTIGAANLIRDLLAALPTARTEAVVPVDCDCLESRRRGFITPICDMCAQGDTSKCRWLHPARTEAAVPDDWMIDAIARHVAAMCPFTDEALSHEEMRTLVCAALEHHQLLQGHSR